MNLYAILYWSCFSLLVLQPVLVMGAFSLVFPSKHNERQPSANWLGCPSRNREGQLTSNFWVTNEGLDRISQETNIQKKDIVSLSADVIYYDTSIEPSLYRINPHRDDDMKLAQNEYDNNLLASSQYAAADYWQKVEEVVSLTYKWCSNFVQPLNLCPWAKLSLQSKNSIKIHILRQSLGLKNMENIVRKSALELMELIDGGKVDENSGITFVVAMHDDDDDDAEVVAQDLDFDFETFYNFCTDFEDRLLDEDEVDIASISIGDEIIIAPFHPEWRWSLEGQDDALNFEKKSPFPTISIVRSRVVFDAGEETTRRIGMHNEKILSEMGSKSLEEFYETNVFGCKNSNSDTG